MGDPVQVLESVDKSNGFVNHFCLASCFACLVAFITAAGNIFD